VAGRTRSNKIVNFEGDLELVGKLVPVQITKAYPHSLRGEIVPAHCRLQDVPACRTGRDCRIKNSEILI
jgi:tRNA-2-methylthio-N6-dimethylallyladenosine synthase